MKTFKIYQLPVNNPAVFMSLEFVRENDIMPKLEDYKLVAESHLYEITGATVIGLLDSIYHTLNLTHPDWFKGRSLSISDIIEIDGKYYYCDDFSWEQVEF